MSISNPNPVGVSSTYRIDVLGYVAAKPRPRFTRAGHAYTPSSAKEAEYRIATEWASQVGARLEGPLAVAIVVTLARPQGHYGARGLRPSAPAVPVTRPDVDNYAKTALDGLNGVAWADDGAVARLTVEKRYGEMPGWRIEVEQLS